MDSFVPSVCNVPRRLERIQSIGVIFIVDRDMLKVVGFSENAVDYFNMKDSDIWHLEDISKLFDANLQGLAREYLCNKISTKSTRVVLRRGENEYYCHVYRSNEYTILELERKEDKIYREFENYFEVMNECTTKSIDSMKGYLVDKLRGFLNCDRVMLYEFQEDWTGYVSCESCGNGVQSFKDLYFYENDIPHYVRGLYCKNPMRYIANVEDKGYGIKWKEIGDGVVDKVDVAQSEILSTSVSHMAYLKTMDAQTSYSMAIMKGKRLWGLMICHNTRAKYFSPAIRQQCFNMISPLSEALKNREIERSTNLNFNIYNLYKYTSIFNFVTFNELSVAVEYIFKQMLVLLEADCYITNIRGHETYSEQLYFIISTFVNRLPGIYETDNLIKDIKTKFGIELDEQYDCSMILIKQENTWIAYIKKIKKEELEWAGRYVLRKNDDGVTIPRGDFSIYKKMTVRRKQFTLTSQNVKYLSQLFAYIVNKQYKIECEKEYFLDYNNNTQLNALSNMSHEIRSPLNGIIGIFELLSYERQLSDSSRTLIRDGMSASYQLLDLITNLISYTRNKTTQTVNYKEINWSELVSNCINTYKYITKEGVKMQSVIDTRIPLLTGDTIKLQQILSNLVSNSVKHTHKGTIVIKVEYVNKTNETHWIKLSVTDTGKGIPQEQQGRLFKTFEQIETNTLHSSGLGLALSKQLVEIMNGTISFESKQGIGSKFYVIFPLMEKKCS